MKFIIQEIFINAFPGKTVFYDCLPNWNCANCVYILYSKCHYNLQSI